jgi:RHS repeat-associated protein
MRIARGSSLLAFGLSFFCTFTTASTVDTDAAGRHAVPGDFNGDGLVDALYQPLDATQPSGIIFRDSAGKLSIPGQVWDAKYLGLDWSTDASVLHTADFRGLGRADVLLQAAKSDGPSALLFATPGGQFLNIGQKLPNPSLGFDWSADSHRLYTGRFDGGLQSEVLLQATDAGGLNGIVHADSDGHLTQLVETWPDDFLGIPWDASAASLYVGDFNGDGQDDLLVQMNQPDPTAQGYFLLLADSAGKFSTIRQSWGADAFGADWNPATHRLSVETIDGVTSLVVTSTTGGSNYVFQADGQGTFAKPAAKWKGPQSATDALKSKAASKTSGNMSIVVSPQGPKPAAVKSVNQGVARQMTSQTMTAGTTFPVDSTGELSGSGGVSGGAGSYSIPIAVPPGIAGMQPSLSISYSSKGGNGDLGMGWSLSGLSAVHRCPSTQAQDGLSVGVNYKASPLTDRLCLDGQHLMAVSGTYGTGGAIYRTELDSGVIVRESGPISSGTSSFEVDYQDGRKLLYGYDSASNIGATVVPAGAPAPLVWAESQEQDPSANNIIYSYLWNGGEYHISAINYTGSSSGGQVTAGTRQVKFNYQTRSDPSVSYLAGGSSQETEVLTSISIEVGGTEMREYDLSYAASGATGRSLLQSAQECGFDSGRNRHCLPATTFTWQNDLSFSSPQAIDIPTFDGAAGGDGDAAQALIQVEKDYFGDGRKALYYYAPGADPHLLWLGGSSLDINTDICDDNQPGTLGAISEGEDFNDDGKAEVGCIKDGYLNIVRINPDGTTRTPYATPIATGQQLIFGDFTGDGMEDVLTVGSPTDTTPIPLKLHPSHGSPGGNPDYSGTSATLYPLQVTQFNLGSFTLYGAEIVSEAGDLDGDGIPDLFLAPGASDNASTKPYKILFVNSTGTTSANVTMATFASLGLPDLNDINTRPAYWTFMDINGDGLADFVFVTGATWKYQLNLGNRQFAAVYDTQVAADGTGDHLHVVTADIDNDGQQEILVPDQVVYPYCWTPAGHGDPGEKCATMNGPATVGPSADRSIYKWNVLKFVPSVDLDGNVTYTPQIWGPQDQIEAPVNALQVGDLDGNGLTAAFADYSSYYHNGYYEGSDTLGGYNAVRNTAGAPDLMVSAISGLGRESDWQYQSLTDLWHDSVPGSGTASFYNAGYGSDGCEVSVPGGNPDPSYYCFATSMYVVSDYKQTDEAGGLREYHYGYEDAVYNGQGRGFQGFRVIKEYDLATDTTTTTTFNQAFPFSGKPVSQAVRTFPFYGSKLLSAVSYDWQQASTADGCYGATNVLRVQPKSVTANTYDLSANGLNPSPYMTTVTNYVVGSADGGYDSNGNNTYGDIKTTDYTSDGNTVLGSNETTTVLSYSTPQCGIYWSDWVDTKSVTSTVSYNDTALGSVGSFADGSSIERDVKYVPNTSLRKLQEEKDDYLVGPEKDATYGYDSFGNVNSVTVSSPVAVPSGTYGGLSNAQDYGFSSRQTTSTYTTDGYFVSQVSDPLGDNTKFTSYDIATGQPTSVTAMDGVVSTYAYDAFGRKVREIDGPMPEIDTSYTAVGSAVFGDLNALQSPAYVVNTTQAGYPSHSTYYDLYGKVLQQAVDSDRANTPMITDTNYDSLGHVTETSEPFFHGATKIFNTVGPYDVLNRPQSKTDAEGVITTYAYDGLTTTVTTTPGDNSFGGATKRVDVETRNSLGKLLSVENAQGTDPNTTDGTTQFRYDAQGNPALIQDAKGNQTLASYNLLGQKIKVADPDQGTSTFAYDVLGEMLQQTDAKGQVTMQTYDLLGRMTTRTQTESQPNATAIWCYDGQTINATLPLSCTGSFSYQATGKLTGMGQSDGYSETYSFDTSGRPFRAHTTLPGGTNTYNTDTGYDQYSRVATTTYPGSFPDTAPTVSASTVTGSSITVALDNTSNSASVNITGTVAVSSHVFNTVYTWTVSCTVDSQNGPSGAPPCGTIATPNAPSTTFTAQDVGTYTLTLTVTDGFLVTASNTVTITVLPGTPGRPSLSSDYTPDLTTSLDGTLSTSWGAAAGATYYKLSESTDGGVSFSYLKNESGTSDVLTGKGSYSADYTYEYKAQACDSVTGLCGGIGSPSSGVIVTYLPQPVTGVSVPDVSDPDGSFTIDWVAPSLGYVTEYDTKLLDYDAETQTYVFGASGCTSTRGASAPATSCSMGTGLQNNHVYYVQVRACNVTICTAYSPQVPVDTNVRVLKAPTNLHLSPNPSTTGSFTLSWTAPDGVTYAGGFEVYQSANNGAWTDLNNVTTTSRSFSGRNNGSYRYKVTGCVNATLCSGYSAIATETVAAPPGTASLSSTDTTVPFDGSYILNWSTSGPITSYTLQESDLNKTTGAWGAWGNIYTGTNQSLRVNSALVGSYRYRVQACNSTGCGAWSGIVTVQVSGSGGGGTCPPTCQQVVKKPVGSSVAAWKHIRGTAQTTATDTQTASAQNGSTSTDDVTSVEDRLHGSGAGRLTFSILSPPVHGTVALIDSAEGRFVYVPASGYTGADAFTFDVADANGTSSAATETVTVAASVAVFTPSAAEQGADPTLLGDSVNIDFASESSIVATPEASTAVSSDPLSLEPLSPGEGAGGEGEAAASRHSDESMALATLVSPDPVVSAGHRAFAQLHPKFALPVYAAYADAHMIPASGTQVMARLQVAYGYTSTGYLNTLTNALSPTGRGAFWTLGTLNAHGEVKSATYGNGVVVTNQYSDPKGRITSINTVNGSGATIQNNTYSWYHVGNLETRLWQASDGIHNPQETFGYDVLNRLTSADLVGTSSPVPAVNYAYNVLGNITSKSDTGTYAYGQGGAYPHAVATVTGTVNGIANPGYHYDADGNMDTRAGTNVQWNSLNLPFCIDATGGTCSGGAGSSSFSYAPDKHRYQQVAVDSSGISETTVYVGSVEFVTNSATPTTTVARHMLSIYGENILGLNIGDTNCSTTTESICFNYMHSDQLGGVDAVTDVNGAPIAGTSFGYDAFGGRRDPVTGAAPTANQVQVDRTLTHRGFTKHEMLDNLNLIHMNGRVYDPALGRFLSVDPVYQAPTNMQSLNPYSYVLNNPLSLTDPSGYSATDAGAGNQCNDKGGCNLKAGDTATVKVNTDAATGSHVHGTATLTGKVGPDGSISVSTGGNNGGQKAGGGQGVGNAGQSMGKGSLSPAGLSVCWSDGNSGNKHTADLGETPFGGASVWQNGQSKTANADQLDALFPVSGGTDRQRQEVKNDIVRIAQTNRGSELFAKAVIQGVPVATNISDSYKAQTAMPGGPAQVEVGLIRTVWTNKNHDLPASLIRQVAHELFGHVIDGVGDTGPGDMDNVRRNENPIMMQIAPQEGERTKYP